MKVHLVEVGAPLNHRRQERARAQFMEQLYWRPGALGEAESGEQIWFDQYDGTIERINLPL